MRKPGQFLGGEGVAHEAMRAAVQNRQARPVARRIQNVPSRSSWNLEVRDFLQRYVQRDAPVIAVEPIESRSGCDPEGAGSILAAELDFAAAQAVGISVSCAKRCTEPVCGSRLYSPLPVDNHRRPSRSSLMCRTSPLVWAEFGGSSR